MEVKDMENKEYMEYQEGMENAKEQLTRKFYKALIHQGINLKEVDRLIIRDVGLAYRYTRIIAMKNNEVVVDTIERESRVLIGILYRQQHLIEGRTGLRIYRKDLFKKERLFPTFVFEWEIDCSNIN